MRIAMLTYSTKPRGGVVHTLALSEALAQRGHEVTVWTLARHGDAGFFRSVDDTVRVRAIPFPDQEDEAVGPRILRSIAVMREAIAPELDGYDIVHAQDCISANAVDGRCIRTIHHLDSFTTPQLVACHDRAVTAPYARICVSQAVAEEVAAIWGLHPTVIPNGVDAPRFEAAAGAEGATGRERWHRRLGRYVLALGGIEPRKGSIDLVEAFARIRDVHPEVRLVFGGGETLFDYRAYRDRFEQRCTELSLGPTVLGTIPDDDLPALVAGAAVLGFVSTKEGFGLAAMEALAAGVPVVARDLPLLRDIYCHEEVLFAHDVAEMADRLDDALSGRVPDPRRGRVLASTYRWDEVAARHETFYRQVGSRQPHAIGPGSTAPGPTRPGSVLGG